MSESYKRETLTAPSIPNNYPSIDSAEKVQKAKLLIVGNNDEATSNTVIPPNATTSNELAVSAPKPEAETSENPVVETKEDVETLSNIMNMYDEEDAKVTLFGVPQSSTHGSGDPTRKNSNATMDNSRRNSRGQSSISKQKVLGNYNVGRIIGEGSFAKVRIATHRLTNQEVC